ncbi:hypothetical protein VNO77_39749 [Canavalia gladiata]|uniref:Uncharacterized protein n=1 Tax=Canavalia gladiata TaxID=3824 RepID=A0AAN9PQT1_CANGL
MVKRAWEVLVHGSFFFWTSIELCHEKAQKGEAVYLTLCCRRVIGWAVYCVHICRLTLYGHTYPSPSPLSTLHHLLQMLPSVFNQLIYPKESGVSTKSDMYMYTPFIL